MNAEPPTACFQMEHPPRRPSYAKRYQDYFMRKKKDLPQLDLKEDEILGASLHSPAFSSDLSTWILTINTDGMIKQLVQRSTHDRSLQSYEKQLNIEQLFQLRNLITNNQIFDINCTPTSVVDGLASTALIVRTDNQLNTIAFCGAPALLNDLDESVRDSVKRYLTVWNAIEGLAPFKSTLID